MKLSNISERRFTEKDLFLLFFIVWLLAAGCQNTEEAPSVPDGFNVHPANSNTPYKNVLNYCIGQKYPSQSRSLRTLPLIGQVTDNPGVEDIMNRVLVSHDWMANNFRTLLSLLPADILELFKATTGVVISSDIRPAYYNPQTGAIYIDPAYIWLTNDEKLTISNQKDSRSDYGKTLKFVPLWRYVKDKKYAYSGTDWTKQYNRTVDDVKIGLAHLLYHELSHANDYFPPPLIKTINLDQTVQSAAYSLENERADVKISRNSSIRLSSSVLFTLSNVLYGGMQPGSAENGYSPDTVSFELKKEPANDMYNFYGVEDIAMVFEEVMLHYHYGIDRQMAITKMPAVQNPTAADYVISWGQKNRFMDDRLKPKAIEITKLLLPKYDLSGFINSLGKATEMVKNTTWADTMYIYKTLLPPPDTRLSNDILLINYSMK